MEAAAAGWKGLGVLLNDGGGADATSDADDMGDELDDELPSIRGLCCPAVDREDDVLLRSGSSFSTRLLLAANCFCSSNRSLSKVLSGKNSLHLLTHK